MGEKAVSRQHGQAVIEKAILIVYGPGQEHGLYDIAQKILGEVGEQVAAYVTRRLFRRGYLQRDYAKRQVGLSSKGQEALAMLDRLYGGV